MAFCPDVTNFVNLCKSKLSMEISIIEKSLLILNAYKIETPVIFSGTYLAPHQTQAQLIKLNKTK
jgi:hypothetical protein